MDLQKLIKTVASNHMKINYCKSINPLKIEYSNPGNFITLEKVYLGVAAQSSINELKQVAQPPMEQIQTFQKSCLVFNIELVGQIIKRFDFTDPLFHVIEKIVDPRKAQANDHQVLYDVMASFPNISAHINIQDLHKEWTSHALLDSVDCETENAGEYWRTIFKIKNASNNQAFPNLIKVVNLLFVLPLSNACVERIFSQLKLIKTDNRNRLNTNTISSLMAVKASVKDVTFEPTKTMLDRKIKY